MNMWEQLYFEKYVKKMRTSCIPDYDFNHYPWQWRIVVNEILAYAEENPQEEAKIFLGDINLRFYGPSLLDRIKELVKKGCKFNIVLAESPDKNMMLLWQDLAKSEKVTVRMKPKYSNKLCHLVLVGTAYRIELPHDKFEGSVTDDTPEQKARFGFYEREFAQRLEAYWHKKIITDDLVDLHVAA